MNRKWTLLILALAVTAGGLFAAGSKPELDLRFDREVHSTLAPEQVRKSLFRVSHWPEWHYDATGATLEGAGPTGDLAVGSKVQLQIDPRGQPWRRFALGLRVLEADTTRGRLTLRLEDDPKGKISAQLEGIEWSIQVEPDGSGSRITGHLVARTHSRRGRFFARLAPRILMNQIFSPNLQKLGGLQTADGLELAPR